MPLGMPQATDPNKPSNNWGQFPWNNPGAGAAPSAPVVNTTPVAQTTTAAQPGAGIGTGPTASYGTPPQGFATPGAAEAAGWKWNGSTWISPGNNIGVAGGVPGSQPSDWGGFNNGAPVTQPTTGPSATPTTPAQTTAPTGGGIPSLDQLMQALASGDFSGLFQGADVFGLPGRSKAGEALSQLIAQILGQQAGAQQPRSEQAEGIIKGLSDYQNPAWAGMQEALGASRNRLGSMDALRSALTGTAQTGAAQTRQNTMQGLRDQGGFGMGAAGFDPYAQAENLAGTQYGQSLRDIELALSAEEGNRIGQLGQLGGQAANVYGQTVAQPDTAYAELLRMQQNPALAALLDYMNQQAQTAVGGDVAFRAQPNDFERIGLPIISGLTGAAGNILGAPQSTTNYYGGG